MDFTAILKNMSQKWPKEKMAQGKNVRSKWRKVAQSC
jgi:hypothetical protein